MEIRQIDIKNFRGIKSGKLLLAEHTALVGDNNTGKSSILEAIDLVLGPERIRRHPVINEHDFYAGEYLDRDGNPILVKIEVIITGLSTDQQRHFWDHIDPQLIKLKNGTLLYLWLLLTGHPQDQLPTHS